MIAQYFWTTNKYLKSVSHLKYTLKNKVGVAVILDL